MRTKRKDAARDVRALVLRAAGTNCDGETVRALELAGAAADLVHLNALAADPARLADYSVVAIAGGFSYGDYVAAGRIFGLELRLRLLDPLRGFVERGGLVVGICNGFQVLVDLGLFQPDRPASERTIAITDNASSRFECRWVTLRSERSSCPFLVPGELMPVPVGHGEGRFMVRDDDVLNELAERGQIALTYVEEDGAPARYPANPNGSVAGIAGICDPTGRVFGMMPHPERNLAPWSHPRWTRLGPRTEGEGVTFYRRIVEAARGALAPAGR